MRCVVPMLLGVLLLGAVACEEPSPVRIHADPTWRPDLLEAGTRCFLARWKSPEPVATGLRHRRSGGKDWVEARGASAATKEHELLVSVEEAGPHRVQFALGPDVWSRSVTLDVPDRLRLVAMRFRRPEAEGLEIEVETNQNVTGTLVLRPAEGASETIALEGSRRSHRVDLRTAESLRAFPEVHLEARLLSGAEETLPCGALSDPMTELASAVGGAVWEDVVRRSYAVLFTPGEKGGLRGEGARDERIVRALDEVFRHRDEIVRGIVTGKRPRWEGFHALEALEIFDLTAEFLGRSARHLQAREVLRLCVPSSSSSLRPDEAEAMVHLVRDGVGGTLVASNAEKAEMLQGIFAFVSPGDRAGRELVLPVPLTRAMAEKDVQVVLTYRKQHVPFLIRMEMNGAARIMVVNRGSAQRAAAVTQYLDITAKGRDWEKVMPLTTLYLSVPRGLLREGANEIRLTCLGYADHRNVFVVVRSLVLEFRSPRAGR